MTGNESPQPMEESPAGAATRGSSSRLFFVDHLRTFLVILVVLHHVAMVYGASAPFYYVEPPFTAPFAFIALLVFALVNQSWFMGAFFLLAGYFGPGSFDRKGPGSFIKERLLRLGIPLIIGTLVLNPIAALGAYLMPDSLTGITDSPTWQVYPSLIGLGPLWFVAMLLIYDLGYAAWRMLRRNRASSSMGEPSLPRYAGIGIFVLVLAVASYLVRMAIPLGKEVVGFPTLAYLPQYFSFFVVGTIAYRRNWFRTLPLSMGLVGFAAAVVAGLLLFPLGFSGQVLSLALTPALDNAMGNGHWQSAVYALWDSTFAVGTCLGLLTLCRRFLNGQGRFGKFLSQHSYAVYLIHIPVIVFLAYALRGIKLAPLLKFGLVSAIATPICFAVAYLVRKIPLASRVV